MDADDFKYQAEFVAASAWRLLHLQDADPASPTCGCFDYKYWRDKTSEFADARFQEAGATLFLLSLPDAAGLSSGAGAPEPAELQRAFSNALSFLATQQYADGSFDEWYKGERGFAATEFVAIAYGLCAVLGAVPAADQERLHAVVSAACGWLSGRHDRVKSNHEAAAAAALAIGWKATGNEAYRNAARDKIDDLLTRQTAEGWFPEIGGMDLGYCSVLLDYVMLYTAMTGDEIALPAMKRLLRYMKDLLHPDMTITAEFGLCLNPYVSRLGMGLMSAYDDLAAAMVGRLRRSSPGMRGLTPTLADDLRLCRWSHLPLAAWLLQKRFASPAQRAETLPDTVGWQVRRESAAAVFHRGDVHAYLAVSGGGRLAVYRGQTRIVDYDGPQLSVGGKTFVAKGYDRSRAVHLEDDAVTSNFVLAPAQAFAPGFVLRLGLRIACTTSWGSYWARRAIDSFRIRRGSAINQSFAPIATQGTGPTMRRRIAIHYDRIEVHDTIAVPSGAVNPASVRIAAFSGCREIHVAYGTGKAEQVVVSAVIALQDEAVPINITVSV